MISNDNDVGAACAGCNDASGYVSEPMADVGSEFSEFSLLWRSDRNMVWRAKRYGRWWVVKSLAPGAPESLGLAALRKEFEIMQRLPREGFPVAVALEEVADKGPAIVMEYVEGRTLGEWLAGCGERNERIRVATALVSAVGRMHDAGVVHRDLKPSNIIVESLSKSPMIIDFGLADTTAHAQLKSPAGTPGYISPEQMAADTPDIRNDVFSLGRILSEMRLPVWWRPAIRRCLKPIGSRMPDARKLLASVSRMRRVLKTVAAAVVMAVAAVAIVWTVIMNHRAGRSVEIANIESAEARRISDSLAVALSEEAAGSREERDRLAARLSNVDDSIAGERRRAERRRAWLDKILESEMKKLDNIWARTAMRYLDTVDTKGFVVNAYTTMLLDEEAQRFLKEMEKDCSREELMSLKHSLDQRIKENMDKWIERRQNMNLDY